jgi:hypothetical protein
MKKCSHFILSFKFPHFFVMGKLLIIIGVIFIIAGLLITYAPNASFFGRLPGDIKVEKENFKFYFPITTSILISILLTVILYLINRWRQ